METLVTRIRRLAPETASRIAAGEVIERPLSAFKEILENALDARAQAIEVRVEGALDQRFSVADDGDGIAAGDLELALERHATSKISALEDLDQLASLGFRGEALPSIAAVSRLRITSRPRDTEAAAQIEAEGGVVTAREHAARAPGTTVEVRDLFFNTPARRKFLNRPAGELRSAIKLVECYGLAFPEVAFRFVVDGKERFDWPAASDRRDRARAIWGPRLAEQLLEAYGERDGMEVAALLGLPEQARATREGQIVIVNRRWVQNPMVAQALRQAYGNLLPAGRFPTATLWLTVPADRLDVNVHPTKREVRFADEGAVFGLVAGACAQPLSSIHPPFTVVRGAAGEGGRGAWPAAPSGGSADWPDRVRDPGAVDPAQYALFGPLPSANPGTDPTAADEPRAPMSSRDAATAEPELWQLHRTYILAPVRGGLVIIDQHAAHERILYEEVRARLEGARGASQQLLFPVLVDLTRSHYDLVLEIGPWLQQLGWNLSLLGPPTVVIHGAPADVAREDHGRFLQDVLDGVTEDSARAPEDDIVEHLARVYACHAAVKAGDPLAPAEMRGLVDRLFATSRPHGDPHGRVTFVRLGLDELHRRFGRT